MIPSNRKVNKSLFKVLMGKGRSYGSESFSMRVALNPTPEPFRVSVVVSKKISKSAVKRNAVKRRMYHLLRPLLKQGKAGILCAFFMKRDIKVSDLPKLKSEIDVIFKQASLLA